MRLWYLKHVETGLFVEVGPSGRVLTDPDRHSEDIPAGSVIVAASAGDMLRAIAIGRVSDELLSAAARASLTLAQ